MKKLLIITTMLFAACNESETITTQVVQEPVARILSYRPAPGQFINDSQAGFSGAYASITTAEAACNYAEERLAKGDPKKSSYITLGGWGGTLEAAFLNPVPASTDHSYELYVGGNQMALSSEPGVVWVSQDTNNDGVANDTWYELRGSEYDNSTHGYQITYSQPDANGDIAWRDNQSQSGTIDHNTYHTQSYFPAWVGEGEITFSGTLLPKNMSQTEVEGVQAWTPLPFAWGYADNYSSIDGVGQISRFRISDAVTASGAAASLTSIDFIRIQTGVNGKAPEIGETSTEVTSIGCYRTKQSN